MLNLNDVRLFVEAVKCGGIAAAARVLRMPKSTLSTRISQLEKALGTRLIQRDSRRFAMTEVGREFYQHGAAMLLEAAAAEDVIARRMTQPSGRLHISCSPGTAHSGLAKVLVHFAMAFPAVEVRQTTTNREVDLIQEGVDLAVRAHERPLKSSQLVQRRIGFSPRWLVAHPSYLARAGHPRSPDDLERHEALLMRQMLSEWALKQVDKGDTVRIRLTSRLCMDDLLSLKVAALAGAGIAALPVGLCRAEVEEGALTRVLPEWHAGGAHITLLSAHRRGQLPSVRALSAYIAQELPSAMSLLE
jgi:DNA-binding transcriptional LysR family regulator